MRAVGAVVLALLIASSTADGAAGRTRRLVESVVLPNYGSDWYTAPTSINNRGDIAGYATRGEDESVAWIRTRGRYQTIADRAVAFDMNDRGAVVGARYSCSGDDCVTEGFVWSRRRGLEMLGSFVPFALNENGDMAGVCHTDQACVMRRGAITAVAPPDSVAFGINRRGDVVGSYGDSRAFHLTPDWQFTDIGRGSAEAINDRRVIAGHRWRQLGERGERAVLTVWSNDVPRSPRREVSIAEAINNRGWVVANAWDADERAYSFVWSSRTNSRVLLQSRSGEWVFVEDINDHGDAVGNAGLDAVIWRVRQRHLASR